MRSVCGVLLALALGLASAAAPVCEAELRRALPPVGVPDGVIAVELLAQAVQQAEPALRLWRRAPQPIPAGERGAEAARFVAGLGLLPEGWSLETHDLDAWAEMLARFAQLYRATPVVPTGGGREAMLADASQTLGSVSAALRPLAVFSVDRSDAVTFFAVIWNWTPRPRLLLLRPPPDLRLGDGRGDQRVVGVLERMSTCAVRLRNYAYAREDLAIRLFGQQGTAIVRVLGSEPADADLPTVFDSERVLDVFRFHDPALDGVRVLAVAVEGPSVGALAILQVIAALRTNIGLDGVFFHLTYP